MRIKYRIPDALLLAATALSGVFTLQSCQDDSQTGQPSWLGESIYEELQHQGNYSTVLHLIDDLGLKEQMSHTGSLTLFAAEDDTFSKWFQTNSWGVRSYGQLSQAQKKLLLYSEEINNAYLIELMSNVPATSTGGIPSEGKCMRRTNSSSIFDSITTAFWQDMPKTSYWKYYRDNEKSIVLFKDGAMLRGSNTNALSQPMIHFLPAFMQAQGFTNEDISILTNGAVTSTSDAYVGGHLVTERDITCKNGYIQKMDGVIQPFPNMAEILRRHSVTSEWSSLIDRFCAPYYDTQKTTEYNRLYSHHADSVFTLRYFAKGTNEYLPKEQSRNKETGDRTAATLAFDPGWNQYVPPTSLDLHYNAGAMLVPTNAALEEWWNHGGKVLQDMYHSWENVPDVVLAPLLNVNMLNSFTASIPSKFSSIVNDAKVTMGVTKADIDSCFIGCNGVVYLTNRLFPPMEYASVTFPALIHQDILSAIYKAIDIYDYKPYLNSMGSYYSLLLPTNDALLQYIDPCSYGNQQMTMFEFYYDADDATLKGNSYACTVDPNGKINKGLMQKKDLGKAVMKNRLDDLINQLIVVGNIEDGHSIYKTKNGTPIIVRNQGKTILGGWQSEHDNASQVTQVYDQSKEGNGKSYLMESNIPQSASKTVYETLRAHPEYAEFLKLLQGSEHLSTNDQLLLTQQTVGATKLTCTNNTDNYNISLFGNYNYNIYVPTNEAIKSLIVKEALPTWDDYDAAYEAAGEETDECVMIKDKILNFVKYHIQDNAVAIDMAPEIDAQGHQLYKNNYESMMLNPRNKRYYTLAVDFGSDHLTVTDNCNHQRQVVKTAGLYNNICREYWLEGTGESWAKSIYASADAIVHLIDGALFYDQSQYETSWRTQAKKYSHRKK